jgi:hypothetical protein
VLNDWMVMNEELEVLWRELVVVVIKVLKMV